MGGLTGYGCIEEIREWADELEASIKEKVRSMAWTEAEWGWFWLGAGLSALVGFGSRNGGNVCNVSAAGPVHVIGSKTPTEYRVQCRTATNVYGPVIVDATEHRITTCQNCGDGLYPKVSQTSAWCQDSNGRIEEAR